MPKSPAQPPRQGHLLDDPRPGSNLPEFSVAEISRLVKKTVEDTFGQVRVKGEISECKLHSSGHIYLTLKDETAVLASVCWRGQAGKLGLRPEVGMEVVCTGRLTTYMGQSKYQLVIDSMALAGMGALLKLLEERKKKLAAEGLFDPARKQLLPFLPEVIGVVTSPTGAVIRDILHRLADRFPRRVLIWPVAVQGEGAARQIAAAIEGFNELPETGPVPRPDVLIVARGGGSVEDLMPFNEEIVVRAAAASHIPVISAVGHETDTTLIDFAADIRAPTPTAAAEMAVPVRENLLAQVMEDGRRLWDVLRRSLAERREKLGLLSRALGDPGRAMEPLAQRLDERSERLALAWQSYHERLHGRLLEAAGKLRHPRDMLKLASRHLTENTERLDLAWRGYCERCLGRLLGVAGKLRHPRDLLALAGQRLVHLDHALQSGWRQFFQHHRHRLEALGPALDLLSPKNVLARGYALVQDAAGHVVASRAGTKSGDKVRIEFSDGTRNAVIGED
ncbi:MAG: exodeoxyribonuclease VII large subunit [Bdellovibrionales bacterium]